MAVSSFPGEFLEERPAGAAPLASRYLGKLQITGKKQHSADSFAPWPILEAQSDQQTSENDVKWCKNNVCINAWDPLQPPRSRAQAAARLGMFLNQRGSIETHLEVLES